MLHDACSLSLEQATPPCFALVITDLLRVLMPATRSGPVQDLLQTDQVLQSDSTQLMEQAKVLQAVLEEGEGVAP